VKSPQFWIDEWYLQEGGTSLDYTIRPAKGTWLYLETIQTNFVDAVSADNTDSTMPMLSYDKILAMTPVAGYIRRRYSESKDDPIWEDRFTNLLDLLSCPWSKLSNFLSDGTNTLITVIHNFSNKESVILKSENNDRMVFTIEDDFSVLLAFHICVRGYEWVVPND